MTTLARRFAVRMAGRLPRRAAGELDGMWITNAAHAYWGTEYEATLSSALRRLARPGFVCADVGAHYGYFTLLAARLTAPTGRVVAFEAQPDNAAVARRHVVLNRLRGRVEVVQVAVSDRSTGAVDLYPAREGGSSEWTTSAAFAAREDVGPRSRSPISVLTTTLDDAFRDRRLDLVKIDVEGGEGAVVAGMTTLLRTTRPIIALEFHRPDGWPAIETLASVGYRFELPDGSPLPVPTDPSDVPYHILAQPT